MALTDDERKYFDEKFDNVNKRIDAAFSQIHLNAQENKRIQNLEVEMGKRPTVFQLLAACAATFTIAISFAGLIFKIIIG